jgi:hypothetical protein
MSNKSDEKLLFVVQSDSATMDSAFSSSMAIHSLFTLIAAIDIGAATAQMDHTNFGNVT